MIQFLVNQSNLVTDSGGGSLAGKCGGADVLRIIKFAFKILDYVCAIIPVALILLISIDFVRNVIAKNEDDMKKQLQIVIKRIILCVILFLVPTIVRISNTILGNLGVDYVECVKIATTYNDFSAFEIKMPDVTISKDVKEENVNTYEPGSEDMYSDGSSGIDDSSNAGSDASGGGTNNNSCYTAKAKSTDKRVILKTFNSSSVARQINISNPACNSSTYGNGNCTSVQGMAVSGNKAAVYKLRYVNDVAVDSALLIYDLNTGKLLNTHHFGNVSFGHGNGMTYGSDGKIHVVIMEGKKNAAFSINSDNSINFVKSGSALNTDVLGVTSMSGSDFTSIAYDNQSKLYYFARGDYLGKYNVSNKKILKSITRLFAESNSSTQAYGQGMTAYNGIILSGIHIPGSRGYLDLYRANDLAYLGSYYLDFPDEYEAVAVWNNSLVMVYNDSPDKLYILKAGLFDFNSDCTE